MKQPITASEMGKRGVAVRIAKAGGQEKFTEHMRNIASKPRNKKKINQEQFKPVNLAS